MDPPAMPPPAPHIHGDACDAADEFTPAEMEQLARMLATLRTAALEWAQEVTATRSVIRG